jgi:Domain of unknown function (DUF4166)
MTAATLFPSVLGVEFAALDSCLTWVHSGESRQLRGCVTVERGTSVVAKVLGVLSSLPSAMTDAPIEVRIEVTEKGETWTRLFASRHLMVSTLQKDRGLLVERLGPAAFKFRLLVREGTLEWVLEHIAAFGITLPVRWFRISAHIDSRGGRYHFVVDSELRGVGRIVRYEGLLDAAA